MTMSTTNASDDMSTAWLPEPSSTIALVVEVMFRTEIVVIGWGRLACPWNRINFSERIPSTNHTPKALFGSVE